MNKLFRCHSKPEDELKSISVSITHEIGSGTYAKVYKGLRETTNDTEEGTGHCAVKVINRKTAPQSFLKKFLPRELDVARRLDHRNVIKTFLIHDVRSSDFIFIISELARTDLLEYMKLKGALRETLVRRLFYDLASGVNYMHSIDVVHRDIKWYVMMLCIIDGYFEFSENCLIGYDGVLKLGDFGFARTSTQTDLSRTFCGSTVYAAPEILTAKSDYNPRYSDVWSCGIVLYAMFTAKMPFGRELLNKFVKLQIVELPVVPASISNMAIRVIRGILLFNPEHRLKLNLIAEKKHEWFSVNALNTTS